MASSASSNAGLGTDMVDLDYSTLASAKFMLSSALTTGSVSPKDQIDIRTNLANALIYKYDSSFQRNPQLLLECIENTEAVLRLLPDDSQDRPDHLGRLSYARASEFLVSGSRRSIDEAVRCGRLAKREADATGLKEKNLTKYCEIVNNAGFALSHRATAGGDTARSDQDEAIGLGRELKDVAEPGSEDYLTANINLASRLHIRSANHGGDPADYEEAAELLKEVLSTCPPGSMKHGVATTQLGQMAIGRFNKSGLLEDLDSAITQIDEGLKALPKNSELRPQCLNRLVDLYSSRYKKMEDLADLRKALDSSNEALNSTPDSQGVRGKYLLQYMRVLLNITHATTNPQQINEVTTNAKSHLISMPPRYHERGDCCWIYGAVLIRQYVVSQNLEHLNTALSHITDACQEYNSTVELSGTKPQVDFTFVRHLLGNVKMLYQAPPGPTKDLGLKYVYGKIAATCGSSNVASGLVKIKEFANVFSVYADAAHNQEAITYEEADKRATDMNLKEIVKITDHQSQPQWKPEPYETELGLRALTIDPTRSNSACCSEETEC